MSAASDSGLGTLPVRANRVTPARPDSSSSSTQRGAVEPWKDGSSVPRASRAISAVVAVSSVVTPSPPRR
nr:hypothetical protein [Actinomadura madurae]